MSIADMAAGSIQDDLKVFDGSLVIVVVAARAHEGFRS